MEGFTQPLRKDRKGLIFDIERCAVHDGPGIRTTVFLKGCPLNCLWCHNPEAISPQKEIMFFEDKCINCGRCVSVCPNNVHTIINRRHILKRDLCQACGKCIEGCFTEALQLVGKCYTVEEVIGEVQKDKVFYENSNGGITLSGGEPTYQLSFISEFLKKCKELNFHTALDTCGYFRWESFVKITPYLDMILYDIKHLNSSKHKQYTGVENELILKNLSKIVEKNIAVLIRMPLVPGINDSLENIENTAKFINSLGINVIEILSYHEYGSSKYKCLGKKYSLNKVKTLTREKKEQVREIMNQYGVNVKLGVS